jgi:hypothetical protein
MHVMARSLIITKPRAMPVDWGTSQTDARAILANIIHVHGLGPVRQIVQNVSLGGRQIRQRASRPVIALGVRTWTSVRAIKEETLDNITVHSRPLKAATLQCTVPNITVYSRSLLSWWAWGGRARGGRAPG